MAVAAPVWSGCTEYEATVTGGLPPRTMPPVVVGASMGTLAHYRKDIIVLTCRKQLWLQSSMQNPLKMHQQEVLWVSQLLVSRYQLHFNLCWNVFGFIAEKVALSRCQHDRRLKRRNTLGGSEISIQHQTVNTLELSAHHPPPSSKTNHSTSNQPGELKKWSHCETVALWNSLVM